MKLFTKEQYKLLLQNGTPENQDQDHFPVVKLFTPDANCTWLISQIDAENPDLAFGLGDLGVGFPEMGFISLTEISELSGKLGLPVERDYSFVGKFPLSVYARAALKVDFITTNEVILQEFL